jgi:two-component system sensor histidine kinase DegS
MWRRLAKITQSLPDPLRIDALVRRQLARRLHDGPTQSVAALAMRADLAQRASTNTAEELAKLEELARQSVRELRYYQFLLAPQSIDIPGSGLETALQDLVRQLHTVYNQAIELDIQTDLNESLPTSTQQQLFLIACEALDNVCRHAEAPTATLRLHAPERGMVMLEANDEGHGFDPGILDACEQAGKLGVAIMAERVKLLRGELHVDAHSGVGCHLRAAVPA